MTKSIAIYGAGGQGRIFHEVLCNDGLHPNFFIDQFSTAAEVMGTPVLRLAEVSNRQEVAIYVSIHESTYPGAPDGYDLIEHLKGLGFGAVRDFTECLQRHPGVLSAFAAQSTLWMRSTTAEMINEDALACVAGLLHDERSRDLLARHITFRRTMAPEDYVWPDGQVEYFPADVDMLGNIDHLRFVDCGAYRGDTLDCVMELGIPVEYVASFEPDDTNRVALVKAARRQADRHPNSRFFVYPSGVWSSTGILHFDRRQSSSSTIVSGPEAGTNVATVPVTSLDVILAGAAPNFIKMDVEGAEMEALAGCTDLIRKHRPNLAICVYHRPADLWAIPLYINELCPDYRMALRTHGHKCSSTVLYCRMP